MFALINSQFLPLKNLKLEKEAIDDIHLRLNSAANHVVIVWQLHYTATLKQEMGNAKSYQYISTDESLFYCW